MDVSEIKNLKLWEKVSYNSKGLLLETIVKSIDKFERVNNQFPNTLFLSKGNLLLIRKIFFENEQLSIKFTDLHINNLKITPYSMVQLENSVFSISLIEKENGSYFNVKTEDEIIHTVYLWTENFEESDLYLAYDTFETPNYEYFRETNPNLIKMTFLSDSEMEFLQRRFQEFINPDFVTEEFLFGDEYLFFENLISAIDSFLYKNHKFPNVIVINDIKFELLESIKNKGFLPKTKFSIEAGMLTQIQINLDNEERIRILIENEISKTIFVVTDNETAYENFVLVADESFPGKDDDNNDIDEDDCIINSPVNSPVLIEFE